LSNSRLRDSLVMKLTYCSFELVTSDTHIYIYTSLMYTYSRLKSTPLQRCERSISTPVQRYERSISTLVQRCERSLSMNPTFFYSITFFCVLLFPILRHPRGHKHLSPNSNSVHFLRNPGRILSGSIQDSIQNLLKLLLEYFLNCLYGPTHFYY
jgi:hypothetical protein